MLHLPIVDRIEFSVRWNFGLKKRLELDAYRSYLNKRFDKLCKIIEDDIGMKLQQQHDKAGNEKYYVPRYRIYIELPNPKYGYGNIYLQPDKERLAALDRWLHAAFGRNLNGIVSLKEIELAYDYVCQGLIFEDYERLALRVGACLIPRNGVYTYAAAIIWNKRHKCDDGAVNGTISVYVQCTTRKDAYLPTDELKKNKESSGDTIIYAKEINKVPFLRVEHTFNKAKAGSFGINVNARCLPEILDLPTLPFKKIWCFKHVTNLEEFSNYIAQKPGIKYLRLHLWNRGIRAAESNHVPVADCVRYMTGAARGNAILKNLKRRLIKQLDFRQVVNMPLPKDFYISQRRGKHALPEDSELPDHIELRPYIHKPLPKPSFDRGRTQISLLDALEIKEEQAFTSKNGA